MDEKSSLTGNFLYNHMTFSNCRILADIVTSRKNDKLFFVLVLPSVKKTAYSR